MRTSPSSEAAWCTQQGRHRYPLCQALIPSIRRHRRMVVSEDPSRHSSRKMTRNLCDTLVRSSKRFLHPQLFSRLLVYGQMTLLTPVISLPSQTPVLPHLLPNPCRILPCPAGPQSMCDGIFFLVSCQLSAASPALAPQVPSPSLTLVPSV